MNKKKKTLLRDLKVLIFDIQATGANPKANHILEIGWAAIGPETEPSSKCVLSSVIQIPADLEISRHVRRITGLTATDFGNAHPLSKIWHKVMKSAKKIRAFNGSPLCPLIVHYARFEEPFLHMLHQTYKPDAPFPFHMICTHEIAKRLFPDLPRKGLRAVAGYLGFSTEHLRRSSHHVIATGFIWQSVIPVLENQHKIMTYDDLMNWMTRSGTSKSGSRAYPMKASRWNNLPDRPGIYRMRRSNRDVLYLGKATSLKQRVRSYFQKKGGHSEHVLEMLSQARDIDFTVTLSALEAAMLESDSIKALSPPYNISLKQGNRDIHFFTRGLDSHHTRPTDTFCTGPILSQDLFPGLSHMVLLLRSGDSKLLTAGPCLIPGLPAEYLPDDETCAEGFRLFSEKYERYLQDHVSVSGLLRIGTLIWQERLQNKEGDHEKATSDGEEDCGRESTGTQFAWTPDGVARTLESMLSRSSCLIRRSRWFCLLSESSLTWQPRKQSTSEKILMIIHNGNIKRHVTVPAGQAPPVPPGYLKKIRNRQRCFDLAAYDRMRVLTTELRRLIKEDRFLELRFSPRAFLKKERLKRWLQWV